MTQALANPPAAADLDERLTFEEFEALGDAADGFELVAGYPKKKAMSLLADYCTREMTVALTLHFRQNPGGQVFVSESLYRLGVPDAARYGRKPDVSVLMNDQLPGGQLPPTSYNGAPLLAFESVSPGDDINDFESKIAEYRAAGVKLIWAVFPAAHPPRGRVYEPGGVSRDLGHGDHFDGGDVIPGFRARVGDILPPPEMLPPPASRKGDVDD